MATGNIVVPDAQVQTALNLYYGSGSFTGPQLAHLFNNNLTPTPVNVLGDFTETSYSGYAAQSFSYSGPSGVVPGQYALTGTVVNFPMNGGGSPETLYGIFVTHFGTGAFLFSWRFASPIVLNPGDPGIVAQVVYDAWAAILI